MPEPKMFQDVKEAVEEEDYERARDLLTRLLKADRENPNYWLWMSAVVETTKERVYCLKETIRLDPQNETARRGLIFAGELTPDDDVQPVPYIRRNWQKDYIEQHKPVGLRALWEKPSIKISIMMGALILLFILVYWGIYGRRDTGALIVQRSTKTPGPPPTYTSTPTIVGADKKKTATPAPKDKDTLPLWELLEETYTPTPLYVNTPHAISEAYRAAQRAFLQEDWDSALMFFRQAGGVEPNAADIKFYIGEVLRYMDDLEGAEITFNEAISIDSEFAPAYLGRARTNLAKDSLEEDEIDLIEQDLLDAIMYDENLGEAYLEYTRFLLNYGSPEDAMAQLTVAEKMLPESPLVYLYKAQISLDLGDYNTALIAAQEANELDVTMLPVYLILGDVYILKGNFGEAVELLELYSQYHDEDVEGWILLGKAYAEIGRPEWADVELSRRESDEYQTEKALDNAVKAFETAIALDETLAEIYLYRGLTYLSLGEGQNAVNDMISARERAVEDDRIESDPSLSFSISLGLGRALIAAERLEDGLAQLNGCQTLAETDEQLAAVYYWRAQAKQTSGNLFGSKNDWEALLELPGDAAPYYWIERAQEQLAGIYTPTPTSTNTLTPTPTTTPTATSTET